MPDYFRDFEDTHLVNDCTEIKIQKPSGTRTYSSPYKHSTTERFIQASPDGYISFVSRVGRKLWVIRKLRVIYIFS